MKARQVRSNRVLARESTRRPFDHGGEAVAGGAVHRPVFGEVLVRGDDLLRHHPERSERRRRVRRRRDPRRRGVARLQPRKVPRRIVEPVGMVDAQAVDLAACRQVENQAVGRVEHRLVLGAEGREVVDVEETPVVDLVGGDAPERETVRLRLEQLVQRLERLGRAGRPVRLLDRALDGSGERGLRQRRARRARACSARPGSRARRAALSIAGGQRGEAGGERRLPRALEHATVLARVDREAMPVVADRELARVGVEPEAQLTALEDHAVVVAEHRHEHATRHGCVERMPVDVEVARRAPPPGRARARRATRRCRPP